MKPLILFAILAIIIQFAIASSCDKSLKIASYNTGLVPGDNGHLPKILKVIPKTLDVLALQEVWLQSDATNITETLKRYYPFSYFGPMDQGQQVGCKPVSQQLFSSFFGCLGRNNITTIGWDTITPCINELANWMANDYNCAVCFIASISSGSSVGGTYQQCFAGTGYAYAYGGSTGLLVLSKKPIYNATYTPMSSFLLRRGLMEMCIDGLYVIHSHYPFEFLLPLAQDIQTDFSRKIISKRPNIVLGDLNTGLNYQPAGYQLLTQYGYRSINPNLPTYCVTNSSIAGSCNREKDLGQKIDHILFDNEIHENSLTWIRKTRFSLTPFGNSVPSVSDHIGIASELSYKLKRRHIHCA